MRKVSLVKRIFAVLLAAALVLSCVLSAYAGSTFSAYTGDTSRNVVTVDLTAAGGGTVEYNVAGDVGSTSAGYYATFVPLAAECTATAVETPENPFLFWKDNYGGRVYSYEKTIRFISSTKVGLTAVFSSADETEHMVNYVNYGGTLLMQNSVMKKGVAPTQPFNPVVPGFTFERWSMTPEEIAASADNLLVTPVFTVNPESYTVTITNDAYVSGAGVYSNYQTVNLTAEEKDGSGQTFSYWKTSDGTVVSYDRNYSFRINYDVTLTAVYGETVTPQPVIRVTKIVRDPDTMSVTFFAERSVPDTYTVVSHGMLMSVKASIKDAMVHVGAPTDMPTSSVRKVCGTSNENCGTFSLTKTSVNSSTTVVARAYVICMDNAGGEHILYSDVIRTTLADEA